ncbi:TetR/AcrR family transcriptional regulator [Colwellia sp. 1_MG-2023]|uniref:TetR/AcrR family transcriptional regulator n=1 Tax=unclassified Colwellia TaxID=196834 RepID=UPI001C08B297|nr:MULTISPECIES: TetR/AcrR family transcriptional regulator [unclassified Colwellia]MBU2923891.1 TetR/AcrR family transcriptional regulator [Colwellia sp. C2M11]MDO6653037.1 TetR/AcrR family transcriptional regulator [Colwellia sp. 3_MG-2023]MDO6665976.1 TetR/AcrR family transcriptional regulator [Colwellia sp. 2_MG-2023]MDO6690349.1 TetR/AcrR family transcriptional regulator [Colwellia sp. 1_MG-2023]
MKKVKETEGAIRQKNKALIFKAAKKEFVTHGFKGASIKRIAERAGIARANIHYYFKDKTDLYQQILSNIIEVWNRDYDTLNASSEPKAALSAYIRSKVMHSKNDPDASRIFASELIHGAPVLHDYLNNDFKVWLQSKVVVIEAWIKEGLIDDVNPHHLLFLIWSSTQHYADFNVQVVAALDKRAMDDDDFEAIVATLTHVILKGCGIS